MDGVHLSSNCFSGRTAYGIRNVVDALEPELSQLYCVVHGDFLEYSSLNGKALSDEEDNKLDDEYSRHLLAEHDSQELKLFDRGVLLRFRNYLCGDWTSFCLLSAKVALQTIEPWTNKIPAECEIFISCVDEGYWEVYARDDSLLLRLTERFSNCSPCNLEDKSV